MAIQRVLGLLQNAAQPNELANWYVDNLGFEVTGRDSLEGEWNLQLFGDIAKAGIERVVLEIGDEQLQIWGWPGVKDPTPYPECWGGNDHWFQHICLVSDDLQGIYSRLLDQGINPISTQPQCLPEWNSAAAGIWAAKFKDPAGHPLELLQFPADKGDSRWHEKSRNNGLPKGIDHSAISIASTETSLRFYRNMLGLEIKGESLNHGPEQDAMDGLQGTRVAITGIGSGPHCMGVEFLHYIAPSGGRDRQHPNWSDACDRKLLMRAGAITALHELVINSELGSDCSPLVSLPAEAFAAQLGFTVRDPDGHSLLIVGAD